MCWFEATYTIEWVYGVMAVAEQKSNIYVHMLSRY